VSEYTDEGFEQSLSGDLGWRRIELVALRGSLEKAFAASKEGPATRSLSRAMIALAYAHWEGYTKNCLEAYSKLVAKRRPKLSESCDSLTLDHCIHLVKRVESGDADARRLLIESVRGRSDERLRVDRSALANTRSNLRFDTLCQLFELGSLPIDGFSTRQKLIDVVLCDRRNEIAHGRASFPGAQASIDTCDRVIELLEMVRTAFVNQVCTRGYLRQGDWHPGPA